MNKAMWSLSSCVLEFPCFFPPYNQTSKLTPELFLWDGLGSNFSLHPPKKMKFTASSPTLLLSVSQTTKSKSENPYLWQG